MGKNQEVSDLENQYSVLKDELLQEIEEICNKYAPNAQGIGEDVIAKVGLDQAERAVASAKHKLESLKSLFKSNLNDEYNKTIEKIWNTYGKLRTGIQSAANEELQDRYEALVEEINNCIINHGGLNSQTKEMIMDIGRVDIPEYHAPISDWSKRYTYERRIITKRIDGKVIIELEDALSTAYRSLTNDFRDQWKTVYEAVHQNVEAAYKGRVELYSARLKLLKEERKKVEIELEQLNQLALSLEEKDRELENKIYGGIEEA